LSKSLSQMSVLVTVKVELKPAKSAAGATVLDRLLARPSSDSIAECTMITVDVTELIVTGTPVHLSASTSMVKAIGTCETRWGTR